MIHPLQRSALFTLLTCLSSLLWLQPQSVQAEPLTSSPSWQGERLAQRYSSRDQSLERLVIRIDDGAQDLRRSVDDLLDRSRLDDTQREDQLNELLKEFSSAARDLRKEVQDRDRVRSEVQEVLGKGAVLDRVFSQRRLTPQVERQWAQLRGDLKTLARIFRVEDWPNIGRR